MQPALSLHSKNAFKTTGKYNAIIWEFKAEPTADQRFMSFQIFYLNKCTTLSAHQNNWKVSRFWHCKHGAGRQTITWEWSCMGHCWNHQQAHDQQIDKFIKLITEMLKELTTMIGTENSNLEMLQAGIINKLISMCTASITTTWSLMTCIGNLRPMLQIIMPIESLSRTGLPGGAWVTQQGQQENVEISKITKSFP